MQDRTRPIALFAVLLTTLACERAESPGDLSPMGVSDARSFAGSLLEIDEEVVRVRPEPSPQRNAYFGDLHVHTTYSFDAFAFGTTATPADAYRYARGEAIRHPGGFDMQLREPLDFYAVTDHALFLGLAAEAADTSTEFSQREVSEPLHDLNAPGNDGLLSVVPRMRIFGTFIPQVLRELVDGTLEPA